MAASKDVPPGGSTGLGSLSSLGEMGPTSPETSSAGVVVARGEVGGGGAGAGRRECRSAGVVGSPFSHGSSAAAEDLAEAVEADELEEMSDGGRAGSGGRMNFLTSDMRSCWRTVYHGGRSWVSLSSRRRDL